MTDPDALRDELAAAKADNARLRRLLDEAGMPESLRHALRDTIAMLRTIMRRTAEDRRDIADYTGHLEGRLDAIVRIRARTDAFGEADLRALISDELSFHLAHEGDRASLSGPNVCLRPKPAQVFGLAMHELASNAVEHGILGGPKGQVRVDWQLEPAVGTPVVVLVWKELGAEHIAEPSHQGFGTAVLTEMLFYELGARATATYEPDGVRWVLRMPLTPRVGRLADTRASMDASS